MRRPKKMSQMKEQNKTPTKKKPKTRWRQAIYQMQSSKTVVTRMLSELRRRIDELSASFNKELVNIKMEIENIKKEPVRNEENIK